MTDDQVSPLARNKTDRNAGFLLDPYLDWAEGEGIPCHLDFGHDLLALDTKPWDRYDARGCFAHTHGRGDYMANYVLEVSPGKKTRPLKHLYEAIFFVLAGHGLTTVWAPSGEERTIEWGPKALFAIPLNCTYQVFNSSGTTPLRLSCTNDAPLAMNHYHNERFIFDNDFAFDERLGKQHHFEGEGDFIPVSPGRHMWETNFIPDLTGFELKSWEARGKGSMSMMFILADGTLHSHCSEIPAGRYKKAHRHAAGTHVHAATGEGYTLLWNDGDADFKEIPWRHGIMYTPPHWMFHQHFNTTAKSARYFACAMGSRRYPFFSLRRKGAEGSSDTSVSRGGRQIDYEEQDPRIHRKWLEAISKNGVRSDMGDIFDEAAIMRLDAECLSGTIKMPQILDNIS